MAGATTTKDNNDRVRALFEQALKIDPTEADALAGEALTYAIDYAREWTNPETNYDAKILGQADRAIALDPRQRDRVLCESHYLQYTGRWNERASVARCGTRDQSKFRQLYASRTIAENNLGRFEQAKSDAQQAMRLSPRDPQMGWWHVVLGDAELGLGHFDAAIEEYRMDLDVGNHTDPYIDIAAAYALEGKMDEAKSALAEARRLNPKLSAKSLERKSPAIPLWWEGLRKAGLPLE